MNYIKQLQQEIDDLKNDQKEVRQVITCLHKYLLSNKFHCGDSLDGYVNVQDVLTRTQTILSGS